MTSPHRRYVWTSLVFIVLISVWSPTFAFAETPTPAQQDTAEETYAKAVEAFRKRQWAQAAQLFQKAFEQDPDATLAYNTGRAYEYTGDLTQAEEWYVLALSKKPADTLKPVLLSSLERIQNVQKAIREREASKPGLLEISSVPSGARITIDGKDIGTTPYQGAFPPGTFQVLISKDGYTQHTERVVLEAGQEVIVSTSLERSRVWTWVLLGVGVASLTGGVVSGIEAQSELDALETPEGKRLPQETFEERQTSGQNLATLSIALYSVGALATISSIVLYVLEPGETQEPNNDLRIEPQFLKDGAGAQMIWSF